MEAEQQQLRHFLVIEDTLKPRTISLVAATLSLGRAVTNAIVLYSKQVSRHHATLLRVTSPNPISYRFRIIDGDLRGKPSSNGLTINGQRCFWRDLEHGDVIEFGNEARAQYFAIANLSEEELRQSQQVADLPAYLSSLNKPLSTLPPQDQAGSHLSEAALFRLASFPELIPHPILEIDLSGQITYLNPAAVLAFPDLTTAQLQHPVLAGLLSLIQQQGQKVWVREVTVGDEIFEQSIHSFPESDLIRSYLLQITARKQAEVSLRESEERYALAAAGTNEGLWDWNLKTHQIYFSPRWKSLLGYPETDLENLPMTWFGRIHPQDRDRVQAQLMQHLQGLSHPFESEYRMLHADGSYRWVLSRGVAVRDPAGQATRIAGSQTDITSRKETEAQLLHDAFHDRLTDLPNRALFLDRLSHVMERSQRHPQDLFAVLFLDLDRFKLINDSLGHRIGDLLLVAIAGRLQACIRNIDTVARLGGDEFVILLEGVADVSAVIEITERILRDLTLPFNLSGQEVFTSTSIGIALSTLAYTQPEHLLRDADTAMYRAKAQGKACYQIFDSSMHTQAVALLQLETDLRRALERQEFLTFYQPIVELDTGQIKGFEALARWQHPEHGLVSPATFIPLAEETGLINPIGSWILHSACLQLDHWQQQAWFPCSLRSMATVLSSQPEPVTALTMNINVSGKQLLQQDWIQQIQQILQETGLPASRIVLEITESMLVENAHSMTDLLQQIQQLGLQIHIDDFGTGYSSLSYLHSFPISGLKIDRFFISRLGQDPKNLEIIRTMIAMAQGLGISITAEGIETAAQLEQLKDLGCTFGQGYFFAKPLAAEEVESFLQERSGERQN